MPLEKGDSKEAMAKNYKTLTSENKPHAQKIAIMLRAAGKSKYDQNDDTGGDMDAGEEYAEQPKVEKAAPPPEHAGNQPDKRKIAIVLAERRQGYSLRNIGNQLGISGERVRQLQHEGGM